MPKPITKIALSCFGGASKPFELPLDPKKDMTMLFGENGSGKSTLLNAVDIVCNHNLGALESISAGSNKASQLPTVGKTMQDMSMSIHSGPETWTATLDQGGVRVSGPENLPIVSILRRSRVQDLVIAEPHARYEALRRFIDVDVIESSENTLQDALRESNDTLTQAKRDKTIQETALATLWETEGRPGPGTTALEWADNKIKTGIDELRAQSERLGQVNEAVANARRASDDYLTAQQAACDAQSEVTAVEQAIQRAPGLSSQNAVLLVEVLLKTGEYIQAEQTLKDCPTCQRPMAREQLARIVREQLARMDPIKNLQARKSTADKAKTFANQDSSRKLGAFVTAVRKLHEVIEQHGVAEISALNITWPDWGTSQLVKPEHLAPVIKVVEAIYPTLQGKMAGLQKDINQFNSLEQRHRGIKGANENVAVSDRIHRGLQAAHAVVHQTRIAFTQDILNGIANEANSLYQRVHPGENMSLAKLEMDEKKRGSVEQVGSFHGHQNVLPQAVFSESHLDTLGFCVWLALAKQENHGDTVIAIDDVFSSLDAPHAERVFALLLEERPQFCQVIVATHYRLWWERCQNAGGIERIHLGAWDLANGIAALCVPLEINKLRSLVQAPNLDRRGVASTSGVLLEFLLDTLAVQYHCSQPRNERNEYTLGGLLEACQRLFDKNTLSTKKNINWDKAGSGENWQDCAPRPAFTRINQLKFIRNQVGAHFSVPGLEIPDKEIREFGQATYKLVEALTCPNCGRLASKPNNTGTALRCTCPKQAITMTPVSIA